MRGAADDAATARELSSVALGRRPAQVVGPVGLSALIVHHPHTGHCSAAKGCTGGTRLRERAGCTRWHALFFAGRRSRAGP